MGEHPTTPNWAETFLALQSARTVEEMRAVLLAWHGIRGSSVWEEPFMLFLRFHRDESIDAEVTAALLCTDYRWRNASRHLIERIDASGVLDREQLEVLADWFVGEAFEIDIEGKRSRQGGTTPTTKTTLRRPIWPPLRRWAARQLVHRQPERWRDLIDTASKLPARDASVAVAGVMDAAAHLPASDLSAVASIGIGHGSGTVRLAALPLIAMTAGVDAAMATARSDSSAKVRAWRPPRVPEAIDTDDTDARSTPPAPPPSADGQASLFD
jgi:hypothetical protein